MNNMQKVFTEIMGDANELYTQSANTRAELAFIAGYSRDELEIELAEEEIECIHTEIEHCLYAGRDFVDGFKNLK